MNTRCKLLLLVASTVLPIIGSAGCGSLPAAPETMVPVASQTTETTSYYERFFLPTSSDEWFHTGDVLCWNDIFTVCVEEVHFGKTLPNGTTVEEFSAVNRVPQSEEERQNAPEFFAVKADESGTLTSDHLYVDLTVAITCTGRYPHEVFGLEPEDSTLLAVGNEVIAAYRIDKDEIVWEYNLGTYHVIDGVHDQGNGLFNLQIGDQVRLRILYIVDECYHDDPTYALLYTPRHAHYTADTLRQLEFEQPMIVLDD